MTRVDIFPDSTEQGTEFRAIAGNKQSVGRTAGEALDALTAQLPQNSGTLVIVQTWQPDEFFTAEQQRRLTELMEAWREARDRSSTLPAQEQAELESLIDAELLASQQRAARLLRELGQ